MSSGRLYIGHTDNINRRLAEHQRGKSKYTRKRGPWKVEKKVLCKSRSEAMKLEYKLKRMKRPERILKYIDSLALPNVG
ncbi:MAG: GIY-YIG nuclease family protein [Candidatus Marinimicrobia bacterium]|nr:GIY-YIG nuclease family protein [Candidatus Neomarinimicrobiota bacterium]